MIENITQEQWREMIAQDENAVIIDVRTEEEWEEGVISGALLIDVLDPYTFSDEIEKLDKSKNYYVCCKAGGRSFQACNIMQDTGFDTLYNLIGGMSQWNGEIVSPL